ncbi:hypothetical protein [Kitasatospora sp. NPDC058046]|uniref:DUF7507 domain-containing protein n=1 Tax=Kitasatospora sp. NPDC058046 TaxID=3346312 RepID=UPI0036DDD736
MTRSLLRRAGAAVTALTLVALGSVAATTPAHAATTTTCGYANAGSGRYAPTLCWFDFSTLDASQAVGPAGQAMEIALPDGATMRFSLKASGGTVAPHAFPTYSGAYLGNGGHYTGVPGEPALYQTSYKTVTTLTLSGIQVTDAQGQVITGYSLVGADAETTDSGESITWRSSKPIYSLTANGSDTGLGNACDAGLTGLGTTEVTCSARTNSVKTGTAILASQAPDTFSQQLNGGGKQAVAFGVLISQVQIAKKVASRFDGDDFRVFVEKPDGSARLEEAVTGSAGTSATTPAHKTVTSADGALFGFGEELVSGDARNYTASWNCTSNVDNPTLPSGDAGTANQVRVGVGEAVSCTITNTAKNAALSLQKKAGTPKDVNGDGIISAGDTIDYTFDLSNTGDTVLTDLTVTDTKAGHITCPPGELAPGATITCTADAPYVITAQDQSDAAAKNSATASASPPGTTQRITSDPSSTSTPVDTPRPALALAKSADPSAAADYRTGQRITYSFTVTNTGNVLVRDVAVGEGAFSGTGKMSPVSCPEAARALAVGAQVVCTATYTLTQADVDAGHITNTATATGTPPGGTPVSSPPATEQIPVLSGPGISVSKNVSPSSVGKAGETVTYSFTVTNTGNVTLTDVTVTEGAFTGTGSMSPITCPDVAKALPSGAQIVCTATYTLTQADVDAGKVDNSATATGTPPGGGTPITSPPATGTVIAPPHPALTIDKSADTEELVVDETITYSFTVTNAGNVTVTDIAVGEGTFTGAGQMSAITCPEGAKSLAPGAKVVCTATYTVTQADVDAGKVDNSATATGTPPGGSRITTPPSGTQVPSNPQPGLNLVKKADSEYAARAGQRITYTFTLTNTGNVTLANPAVREGAFTGHGTLSPVICPRQTLTPGQHLECTATYTVVAADLGTALRNTATATATTPGGGTADSDPSTATVDTGNPAHGQLPHTGANGELAATAAALAISGGVVVLFVTLRRRRRA